MLLGNASEPAVANVEGIWEKVLDRGPFDFPKQFLAEYSEREISDLNGM